MTNPVTQIARKVKTHQYNFWRISRTQTGPTLNNMRQLYTTKVLPIFSYACGAWYIPPGTCSKYNMNKGYVKKLEDLHRDLLLDVSGGMRGTRAEVLFKELHIHRMCIFLEKTAIVQRARDLDTPHHNELCRIRARAWSRKRGSLEEGHPYHQLDEIARELLDGALKSRPVNAGLDLRKCIRRLADQLAEERSRAAWEDHKLTLITQRPGRIPAAYSDPQGWGRHNLERYANLPRHQSTMLLQCRVEVVAVNATLYRMRAHQHNEDRSKDTPCCPCGYPQQTVEHLFSYCPDLEEARTRELVLRAGTKHVDELLANHPAEASAFAVRHFGICKNKDVELFLPQRGAEHKGKDDKRNNNKKKKGGSPNPAKGRAEQRRHGLHAKERGAKVEKRKRQRRADKDRNIWKKKRRGAVEGQLYIIANGESS